MNFHIDFQAFLSTLPTMALGMGGIFLIIGLIMFLIWLLNKTTAGKTE